MRIPTDYDSKRLRQLMSKYDPAKPKCRNCKFWYKWSSSRHMGSCNSAERRKGVFDRHHGDRACRFYIYNEEGNL